MILCRKISQPPNRRIVAITERELCPFATMEFRPSITSIGRDRKRLIQLILISPYIFRIRASSRFRGKLKKKKRKEKESFLWTLVQSELLSDTMKSLPDPSFLPSFLSSFIEKHNFILFIPLPFLIPPNHAESFSSAYYCLLSYKIILFVKLLLYFPFFIPDLN